MWLAAGLDKLDLRLDRPACTQWLRQNLTRARPIWSNLRRSGISPSRAYDLRSVNLSAILHLDHRKDMYKIELIETAGMRLHDVSALIRQLFKTSLEEVRVVRLDAFVDLPGPGIEWFKPRIRLRHSRSHAEFGRSSQGTIDAVRKGGRTLYFGSRRRQLVVYDKSAELQRRRQRKCDVSDRIPTLTRVEVRFQGQVPLQIRTLQKLIENISRFDPFVGFAQLSNRAGLSRYSSTLWNGRGSPTVE
jgi:hypothetical protein